MSLAGGAPPPPPPPPPPRRNNIACLPAELILTIINSISTRDFISLALGMYPRLRQMRLVPKLTTNIYNRITDAPGCRKPTETPILSGKLPAELFLQITETLNPEDRMALLFTHRSFCDGNLPHLTDEMSRLLQKWIEDG
ncbi:hypothetical protein EJ04DRAFT_437983 [Polyplosphaeria fusca]|uniref:F-box domain-containing protein n=1 Tax=Polyplosphaeria fusca TaxID=682080 RepID=A0A9P4QX21_9PLEO|nr:hypothetical protein EJ04DRAFT_437983 [Polyplosphaeria fusca]